MPKPRAIARSVVTALAVLALAAPPAIAAPAPSDYRLGFGDAVTVTVLGQPTLSVEGQPVRPDGRITLPLVQQVQIEGRTIAQVTADLTAAYQPYLQAPQIVVSVARFRALKVTVLGQVAKPGTYDFEHAPTLAEALASAGGLTDRAARAGITVVTPSGDRQDLDLDALLRAPAPQPRLAENSVVEIHEVSGPDLYRLVPLAASIVTAGALLWRYGFAR
jgi:polysaccharide export outer membrane protein